MFYDRLIDDKRLHYTIRNMLKGATVISSNNIARYCFDNIKAINKKKPNIPMSQNSLVYFYDISNDDVFAKSTFASVAFGSKIKHAGVLSYTFDMTSIPEDKRLLIINDIFSDTVLSILDTFKSAGKHATKEIVCRIFDKRMKEYNSSIICARLSFFEIENTGCVFCTGHPVILDSEFKMLELDAKDPSTKMLSLLCNSIYKPRVVISSTGSNSFTKDGNIVLQTQVSLDAFNIDEVNSLYKDFIESLSWVERIGSMLRSCTNIDKFNMKAEDLYTSSERRRFERNNGQKLSSPECLTYRGRLDIPHGYFRNSKNGYSWVVNTK